MKKTIQFLICLSIFCSVQAQNLTGKKFCLDPGHGMPFGATCDAETKRFEAYINHITVPYLKRYLQQAGATVITTRPDYDSLGVCVSLTERKTIANNAGATWFHSVHHNAFTGTSNYTLTLFKQISTASCPTGGAAFAGQSDVMSSIISSRIYNTLYTTSQITAGDSCFLGYNLGVLSTTAMPGTLSEGSFWDFTEERTRLASLPYLKTEAEALYHSFLQYYGQPLPSHGSLVGIVKNSLNNLPAKNVVVTIPSLGLRTTTDNLGNGFFRFNSLAPGSYTVKFNVPYDSSTITAVVTGSKINKIAATVRQYNFPDNIKIRSVLSSTSSLIVTWERPVNAVDSFYIYLSPDGVNYDTVPYRRVAGTLAATTISGLSGNTQYYVRIKGKNAVGISALYSKSYGAFTSTSNSKILIVDAFDNTFGKAHQFTTTYGSALAEAGVRFESVTSSAVNQVAQLIPYYGVIWFTGTASKPDTTIGALQQAALKDYLSQGGNLFVSGSDFARDLGTLTGFDSKQFLNKYLKINYVNPNPLPLQYIVSGSPNSPASGYSSFLFGAGWQLPYSNVVDTLNGGKALFQYSPGQTAGVYFEGDFPSGTFPGRVISCTFPIESINDNDLSSSIVRMAVSFFGLISGTEKADTKQKRNYLSVYPNPATVNSAIISLPETGESMNIRIYNVLGELKSANTIEAHSGKVALKSLVNELASGAYVIICTAGKNTFTSKIIIAR